MNVLWLIIIIPVSGLIGFGLEKLGQFMYYRRLAKGHGGNNERLFKLEDIKDIASNVDILFLGDSITELCLTDSYYYGYNSINCGIGGDTSKGVLNRLESTVIPHNPKKIVLLIGTNDFGFNSDAKKIFNNIVSIHKKVATQLPNCKLLIESVYPIVPTLKKNNSMIKELNSFVKDYCDKENLIYIDLYESLLDGGEELSSKYSNDGLHLNHKGYLLITSIIKQYI